MKVVAFIARLPSADQLIRRFKLPAGITNPSEDSEALSQSAVVPYLQDAGNGGSVQTEGQTPGRWYAVYTTSRHEKQVARHFEQRAIDHYLPLYVAHRKWRDGSKVALELPLFPCYIFVRMERQERVRVLGVPGALAVVSGTGGEPAPLPQGAVDALRLGLQQGHVEPHPLLTAGQQVRVRTGAFAGMSGFVVRKKNGFRVVLTLEQIMQSMAVEMDEADVEPIETPHAALTNVGSLVRPLTFQSV